MHGLENKPTKVIDMSYFNQNDRVKLTQVYPKGSQDVFRGIVALVDTNGQPFIVWDDGEGHGWWHKAHRGEVLELDNS